ncbi:MAG: pantetheine-phosphate adenylyltransferase [Burkholderiales bacterium]|nr:pantetheine-phosphate adenylyltransferase [Burkholderiales bacterium]
MLNKAVYPGTFDPLTRGHEDLVRRAANIFDSVVVGIADSRNKRPFFSLDERVEMAKAALARHPNVEVVGFAGLLLDLLREHRANIILRGLRAISDFDYEFQLAGMNRKLFPEVETLFLTPSDQFMFISATMVREIAVLGGDISDFVDPMICAQLNAKIHHDRRKT